MVLAIHTTTRNLRALAIACATVIMPVELSAWPQAEDQVAGILRRPVLLHDVDEYKATLEAPIAFDPGRACSDTASFAVFQGEEPMPESSDDSTGPSEGQGAEELAKKLANPVASLISVPLQFNYDNGFGSRDADRYTVNIQPVIPFSISEDWNLIVRTILPVIYAEPPYDGMDHEFALGDTLQSFFFSPKEPVNDWIVGVGPAVLWPTGTTPTLRTEALGLGPTAVALRQDGGWTYGALANHMWGVTISGDHPRMNQTFLQPFLSYTLPSATTLSLSTESSFNWRDRHWTIPINVGVSQVLKLGDQLFSLQLGGRYYVETPSGGPEWGLRFTITLIFPK